MFNLNSEHSCQAIAYGSRKKAVLRHCIIKIRNKLKSPRRIMIGKNCLSIVRSRMPCNNLFMLILSYACMLRRCTRFVKDILVFQTFSLLANYSPTYIMIQSLALEKPDIDGNHKEMAVQTVPI